MSPQELQLTKTKNSISDAAKTAILGLVTLILMLVFWYSLVGNPIDEYKLVQRGQRAPIKIEKCETELVESEADRKQGLVDSCSFTYTANGVTHEGRDDNIDSNDIVVYLPENPAVHLVEGNFARDINDFYIRRLTGAIVLLVMLAFPGLTLIWRGVSKFRQ